MTDTVSSPPRKQRALLFGLNYPGTAAELRGCVNDIENVAAWLVEGPLRFDPAHIRAFADTDPDPAKRAKTTRSGILDELFKLAVDSWRHDLDFVWLHYSGHGSQTRDANGDEADGRDECLIPSDHERAGVVGDDQLNLALRRINPKTRVLCVMDCCHSGSIADLPFRFRTLDRPPLVEHAFSGWKPRVAAISGCRDDQTSADAYGVGGRQEFAGAMTACLLAALREREDFLDDAPALLERLRALLRQDRFDQVPQLACTHDIREDKSLLPC